MTEHSYVPKGSVYDSTDFRPRGSTPKRSPVDRVTDRLYRLTDGNATAALKHLERWLRDLERRDSAGPPTPDGYPSSTGGAIPQGEDVERLLPVETAGAVLAGAPYSHEQRLRADEVHDRFREALALFSTLVDTFRQLEQLVVADVRRSQPARPLGHSEAMCCERHCDDVAAAGRMGRCEPCYRWRVRWAERENAEAFAAGMPQTAAPSLAPAVPAAVIDRRNRVDGARVHVTGPMAEPEVTP